MHEEDEKRHAVEMEAYQNAFCVFVKHNRERVYQENACLCRLDISNICGEEWAALDAKDKKRYEDTYAEDTKLHSRDLEGYNNDTEETEKAEGNKTIRQFLALFCFFRFLFFSVFDQ